MVFARATSTTELNNINDVIHDHWFDIEDVHFDRGRGRLRIRFEAPQPNLENRSDRKPNPPSPLSLVIDGVGDVKLIETEHVGRYDFNVLRYDAEEGALTVDTGIPLKFQLNVSRLDVSIRDPESSCTDRQT